jgi:DNA-binding response OmpR family regulator
MNNKKYTIHVIEDEKMLSDAIKKKLEESGFDVITSYDGQEGLDAALKRKPDLMLLDLVLPTMDGVTVLDKLRDDEWGKKVPVIILTNLSRAETIEESKKRGVHTYLVKTNWKLDEVVEKINYELGIV